MDSSSSSSSSWVSFPSALTFKNMLASKTASNENRQEICYLQNGGGLEVALMENATSDFLATLPSNPTFVSAMLALFMAQSSKVFLNFFPKRQWNFRHMLASQGMPSTRSALCSALATSVALTHGVADSVFPVSLGFSLIVMLDAVAARTHVSYHALVVNTLVDVMFKDHRILDKRLEENVGDTLRQVLAGALVGSAVAIPCCLGFMQLR
ncbi:unnamed protein product [Lathyrus sativus]|nr:unnamed protein product [Lathyrus sativus]